ncbi:MAG: hypothetical protein AAFO69_03650 [Bacteroidota bacterium]
MKDSSKHIWLFGKSVDLIFLFLPVWIVWGVCFLLPDDILQQDIPIWIWLIVVVGIDVSHVWSTIFRTYADKEEFANHRKLLTSTPFICFLIFFLIAGFSQPLFWRILAYIALYHFIKQQYGFMRIYKAKARDFGKRWINDEWVIYLGMLYPVIYWHLTDVRSFSWFVEGDFLNLYDQLAALPLAGVFQGINGLYWLIIITWFIQEVFFQEKIHWGKVLWVTSTAINWFLGIVYFNSDLAFTLTNVVAHGVPYMVLVLYYVEKKKDDGVETSKRKVGQVVTAIIFMVSIVLILAFFEEYFWDMLIYQENSQMFEAVFPFPVKAFTNPWWQAFGIALLTVPQATHYVIDGFIWKSNAKNPHLKRILLDE